MCTTVHWHTHAGTKSERHSDIDSAIELVDNSRFDECDDFAFFLKLDNFEVGTHFFRQTATREQVPAVKIEAFYAFSIQFLESVVKLHTILISFLCTLQWPCRCVCMSIYAYGDWYTCTYLESVQMAFI